MENQLKSVDTKTKKESLESALFQLSNCNPFYSGLIQEMNIKFNDNFPTCAIGYNPKNDEFELILGTNFFISLTLAERSAVLLHEIMHFSNGHMFRFNFDRKVNKEAWLDNIATDMAINQYIVDLPKEAIDYKQYKFLDNADVKKPKEMPFPSFRTAEEYLALLKLNRKGSNSELKYPDKNKSKKDGSSEENGNEGPNKEVLDKYKPFDEHNWGELSEEDQEKLLKEAKKIIERTIEKTSYDKSSIPDGIKSILQDIDANIQNLNYKQILMRAIKKTISVTDRKSTWNRPNKRYGVYAPGTKNGELPSLSFFADSSGSISHTELNEFFHVIEQFLKVGTKKCNLGLWHTSLYHYSKYRYGTIFDKNNVQSGGTDVTEVLHKIVKENTDLSIIITDGYYSAENVNLNNREIIWVISQGGTLDHPLAHVGKTIKMSSIKT